MCQLSDTYIPSGMRLITMRFITSKAAIGLQWWEESIRNNTEMEIEAGWTLKGKERLPFTACERGFVQNDKEAAERRLSG